MRKLIVLLTVLPFCIESASQCNLRLLLLNYFDVKPMSLVRVSRDVNNFSDLDKTNQYYTDDKGYVEFPSAENTSVIYVLYEGEALKIILPEWTCNEIIKISYPFYIVSNDVLVTGFRNETSKEKVSASIGYIDKRLLNNNDQTSLQNAFNSVAGVTMESRGYGGSHRLSIRGSSLRAPFAVRNIKMYANGIPLTSPDGQAPLEMLDASDIQSIEIIKGPAGSVWGSGNGGVLLYKVKQASSSGAQYGGGFQMGSYNLQRSNVFAEVGWEKGGLRVSHVWQDNHGYRENEANRKNQLTLTANHKLNDKQSLFFYGTYYDGRWQLPGGLSMSQLNDNPRQANVFSKNNQVHLARERVMAGLSHNAKLSTKLTATTSAYGYVTNKLNPYGTSAFNNGYKDEKAKGYGGRTDWQYKKSFRENFYATINVGGELQYEKYDITEHSLLSAKPNNFRYAYNIDYLCTMAFASVDFRWKDRMILNLGSSINHLNQVVKGNAQSFGATDTTASWKSDLLPRLGINVRVMKEIYLFAQISKGNSNPTVFEMVDYENNAYNLNLRPEHGLNYEAGVKGKWRNAQLNFEIAAYQLLLTDAILSYTDTTTEEAERTRFANSGSTIQRGVEWSLSKIFFRTNDNFQIHFQTAGSAYIYKFDNYKMNDTQLEGKTIPGVPLFNASTNIQFDWKQKLKLDVTHFWFDKTPLNNSNTAWSNPYNLSNARLSYLFELKKKIEMTAFFGVNNIFNTQYSSFYGLNDINSRYFNPSPPANYFGGISLRVKN